MAENGHFKRYNIPEREYYKREIRRLLIEESYTNREISEKLNLPDRTLRRYLAEIYSSDNQLLIRPSAEDMAVASNIFIEQLSQQRKEILNDIVRKEGASIDDKLAGYNLCAELARQIYYLRTQSPAVIARHLPVTLTPQNKLVEEQRGLNIRLAKKDKHLPSHY